MKPADVIFTSARGGNLMSWLIMQLQRAIGEKKSKTSHVALIHSLCPDTGRLIVEQTFPMQRISPLSKYSNSGFRIYRHRNLDENQRQAIMATAISDLEKAYGVGNLLLSFLDWLLSIIISLVYTCWKNLFSTGKFRGHEYSIFTRLNIFSPIHCAQTVARYYWDIARIEFGGNWRTRNPDNMLDHIEESGEWELVCLRGKN
jgi:hypothetical protein